MKKYKIIIKSEPNVIKEAATFVVGMIIVLLSIGFLKWVVTL